MDTIVVLDFGSQYTQLIARRIREFHFYCEIHPFFISTKDLKKLNPKGIILSGGPASVYDKKAPKPKANVFELGVPVLGICYGLQYLTDFFGGKISASEKREYGFAKLKVKAQSPLLEGLNKPSKQNSKNNVNQVWMSHGDKVTTLPKGFKVIATTDSSPYAIIANSNKEIWGIQFHPEVGHTKDGKLILKNFCAKICGVKRSWTMKNFAKEEIKLIKDQVGKERVILGLSGGVDSTVTAKLLHDAIGDQLTCVYVDTGLMRLGETEAVIRRFKDYFKIKLEVVKAEKVFFTALKGITEPEEKRRVIGRLFIQEFNKRAKKLKHHEFLAQGTLYTDVIESVSVKGPSQTIKSHHNRVQEVLDLLKAGKVVEPLKELFKDEVRQLGLTLGIPRDLLFRHPFPGPGLAIRILGEVRKDSVAILQKADSILLEELKRQKQYNKIWQAFAVLLNVKSVGVMGDKRTYENAIALRMVESQDGMTADFAKVPHEVLASISSRIINEVNGINRVVYDISTKPPATIEWE